jgi:NTP pyrophosphatase (non-canonical NTP hydrolase)
MNPNEYQRNAVSFRLPSYNLEATFAGLAAETGEVLGVRQKFLRDANPDNYDDYTKYLADIEKELGDVLWHIATLADYYDIRLSCIMEENINKLVDRAARNKIKGSGNDR